MRSFKYAVTFEKPETAAPETFRGTIAAGSPGRACDLALREATKARVSRGWDSIVVLLEKDGGESEGGD